MTENKQVSSKSDRLKLTKKYASINYFRLAFIFFLKRHHQFNFPLKNGMVLKNVDLSNFSNTLILLDNGWQILSSEQNFITLKGKNGAVLTLRTNKGYDIGHLVEIWVWNDYGKSFEQMNIIDVGMSNGDSSIYFAVSGAKKVIGIEPFPESYNLAVRNINDSGVQNKVIPLNRGVSAENKPVEMVVYQNYPNANSIDSKNMVSLNDDKKVITIDTVTLESAIEMFDGELIHLLKMDCEGCEYSVLQNLKHDSYERIQKIILEYHNGLSFIPKLLEKEGYEVNILQATKNMGYIKAERKNKSIQT